MRSISRNEMCDKVGAMETKDASEIRALLAGGPESVQAWNARRTPPTEMNGYVSDVGLRRVNLSNKDMRGVNLSFLDLAGADLSSADLSDANLVRADLTGANLNGATLTRANLASARLNDAKFRDTSLIHTNLDSTHLYRIDFSGATFSATVLSRTQWEHVTIHKPNLIGCVLDGANFMGHCNLESARLDDVSFTNANLARINLRCASLRRADLRGANLDGALLVGADLTGCQMDASTGLRGASVALAKIDAYTLECLGDGYGGLTRGHRSLMAVSDDVARLRQSFTGFWQWLHFGALVAFFLPYALFVARRIAHAWAIGSHADTSSWIPLWRALSVFVISGAPMSFAFFFAYNCARIVTLWKAKVLELQQASTGLRPHFSLATSPWRWAYGFVRWGFWLNLAFVVLHTWHFASRLVPPP